MTVWVYPTASVARWLQPKSAKRCHKKLLNSTQSLVTHFQLKSAKSSEILLKNLLFLRWFKIPIKLHITFIFRLALSPSPNEHGLKMPVLPLHFSAQSFSFINLWSNVTAAYLIFCDTQCWRSLSNDCMFLYSRTMFSDEQSEHSFSSTTF